MNVDIVSIRSDVLNEHFAFVHGLFFFADGQIFKVHFRNDVIDEPLVT